MNQDELDDLEMRVFQAQQAAKKRADELSLVLRVKLVAIAQSIANRDRRKVDFGFLCYQSGSELIVDTAGSRVFVQRGNEVCVFREGPWVQQLIEVSDRLLRERNARRDAELEESLQAQLKAFSPLE